MGSAESTPTRGAHAEDKISPDDGEVQLHALALLDAPFIPLDNHAESLLAAVRKIGASAGKITARFDTITAALKGAPNPWRSAYDVFYRKLLSLFKRLDPEKVELLRRQWFEIAQLHKETLWRSRNIAAVNAAKLKSFIEVFIPYLQRDGDLDEKKAEIAAYIEANKKQDNEERQLQGEFQEIKKKLEEFEEEVQEACKTLSVPSERVKELESEIEALNGKIKL
ncbi:hypothetical protein DFH11DRAFT_361489 [Phellopilus nigrolimitatus]|nr:hypothetical protein DFH11DRAFT_361489 [Phellopilus nigrolimitatus]